MIRLGSLAVGASAVVLARFALVRSILGKLRRDVHALNAGDHGPLLSGYADDAALHFHTGPHRWSGEHRGKAAIERFLRDFTGAGLQGQVKALWIGGPLWALTLVVRFDDSAHGRYGEELYANRVVIVARTRWGRIIEQDDFYENTGRIVELERKLRSLGIEPVDAAPFDGGMASA